MAQRIRIAPVLTAMLVAAMLAATPTFAADVMSERQALAAAISILKGDPYGRTDRQVARNIASTQLVVAGTMCGTKLKRPVWQFHVVVPKARNPSDINEIRGFLALDARTGKIVCVTGLPFLD